MRQQMRCLAHHAYANAWCTGAYAAECHSGRAGPLCRARPHLHQSITGARKCKSKPKGDQAPEPRRGDSADASAKLQSPLRCSHQGPGALIFARILGLALKDAGFRLFPRSAGIESGDISPHPTILPVLEQAAFLLAPALEEGGLWSAAKRRRFGFPAKRGDRPHAPFSMVRSQDVGKDQPAGRGNRRVTRLRGPPCPLVVPCPSSPFA
jgi:hypothetical protein